MADQPSTTVAVTRTPRAQGLTAAGSHNAPNALITRTHPGAPAVVDGLLPALDDADPEGRIAALSGLGTQVRRGEVRPVATALIQLNHPFHEVRAAAAPCLEALPPAGDRVVVSGLVAAPWVPT